MTSPAEAIRAASVSRPDAVATYGREVTIWTDRDWGSFDKITVTDEGVTVASWTGFGPSMTALVESYGIATVDEMTTLAVGELHPWECPDCAGDAVLHVTTANGFDVMWCPRCTTYHRQPIAAGADENICDRCRTTVSALERRHLENGAAAWCCVYCSEDLDVEAGN